MQRLIAIHGKMGSGKSTAAKFIQGITPCVIKPFAQPIKDIATLMGWDGNKDTKGRTLLQKLGTECGRECIHSNIWIDQWNGSIENTGLYNTVIVDDLRFQNEYEELIRIAQDTPVTLIHIIRPVKYAPTEKLKQFFVWLFDGPHASERGIVFDARLRPNIVSNVGTLSQLRQQLEVLIRD